MKCDKCYYKAGHVLDQWECGAGNYHEYCTKEHWEGQGEGSKPENKDDPWKDCKDFKRKE